MSSNVIEKVVGFERKRFNRESFNRNDDRARQAFRTWLPDLEVQDSDNTRDPDLYLPELDIFIEVEVAERWKYGNFPWPDLQFSYRKVEKLNTTFAEYSDSVYYLVLCNDLQRGFIVTPVALYGKEPYQIHCRVDGQYIQDWMVRIPLHELHPVELNRTESFDEALQEAARRAEARLKALGVEK